MAEDFISSADWYFHAVGEALKHVDSNIFPFSYFSLIPGPNVPLSAFSSEYSS
jgi:hypothetical protein